METRREPDERIEAYLDRCEALCAKTFEKLERIERVNTEKVLRAFQAHRVSLRHFAQTTGYGYDDIGRDTLGEIFADVIGCEAALFRPQISGGTHALALCLYGILRPGDTLLSAAGKPYDTLEQVIGISGEAGMGSLADFGVHYKQVPLRDGRVDLEALKKAIDPSVRLVLIQRSRGYDWRPSLSVGDIGSAVKVVKDASERALVMVDNCYGEFTDTAEPGDVGADIVAGSLIKNPGGGIAPTGGYIAGSREAVDLIANRLNCPGVGAEVGSYAGGYQPFYQGLFMAPHTVCQALRTAALAAAAFAGLGFEVNPAFDEARNDIVEAIRFGDAERLISFIQSIQYSSPVDSEATPEPWAMPGYQHPVIMAAGTFVAGASIELSADAPVRPPYIAYMQGGLTGAHGRIAIRNAIRAMTQKGYIELP